MNLYYILKKDGVPCKVRRDRYLLEFPTGQNLKFLVERVCPVHGDPNLKGYKEENIYHYVAGELEKDFKGFIKKLFEPCKEVNDERSEKN